MTKITSPSFPLGVPPLRTEHQARLGILTKTAYVPEHYKFQREQSRVMKDCEWEREPVTKGKLLAAFGEFCIGFGIVMGPFCYVVLR